MTAIWLDAAMLLSATGGFLALALASDKPGAALLGQKPAPARRWGLRLLGWPLLALALVEGTAGWGPSVGWVTWLGWLTVAGVGLVFAFPYWERARAAAAARERRAAAPVPQISRRRSKESRCPGAPGPPAGSGSRLARRCWRGWAMRPAGSTGSSGPTPARR
ncbi:DUF3325 domain-containing protein [Cereibacter sphaeroides]|nr:DUF3325 domain-containing protein [Cereibacter sphaeroides]AZB65430.1 DUF3325 domain-containing protein [Cereibacter sphaeroides]